MLRESYMSDFGTIASAMKSLTSSSMANMAVPSSVISNIAPFSTEPGTSPVTSWKSIPMSAGEMWLTILPSGFAITM